MGSEHRSDLSVEAVAELLEVTPSYVKQLVKDGKIDLGDLKSVCAWWYQTMCRRAKQAVKAKPEPITYGEEKWQFGRDRKLAAPIGPVRVGRAARLMGVPPQLLYKLIAEDKIPVSRLPPAKKGGNRGRPVMAVLLTDARSALADLEREAP